MRATLAFSRYLSFCARALSLVAVESFALIRQKMIVYRRDCLSVATLSKHPQLDLSLYGTHMDEDLTGTSSSSPLLARIFRDFHCVSTT